jgi:hypothetical protein
MPFEAVGCIKYKRSFAAERRQTAGQFLWVVVISTHPSGRRGEIRWKSWSEHMHAERPHLARVDMLRLGLRSTPSAHLFFSGHTNDEVLTVDRTLLASPLPAPPWSFSPHAPLSSAGRGCVFGGLPSQCFPKKSRSSISESRNSNENEDFGDERYSFPHKRE